MGIPTRDFMCVSEAGVKPLPATLVPFPFNGPQLLALLGSRQLGHLLFDFILTSGFPLVGQVIQFLLQLSPMSLFFLYKAIFLLPIAGKKVLGSYFRDGFTFCFNRLVLEQLLRFIELETYERVGSHEPGFQVGQRPDAVVLRRIVVGLLLDGQGDKEP